MFGFRFHWTTTGNSLYPERRKLNHILPSCLQMSRQKADQFSLKTEKKRE